MSSDSKITEVNFRNKRQAQIVQHLSILLERAKAGQIKEYAILTVDPDNNFSVFHSHIEDFMLYLSHLERIKHVINRKLDENTLNEEYQ